MQPTQLDPDIVNLAKATRDVESGTNFTAKGKSGEYGAYQYTEPTWDAQSKSAGVIVPLTQATPEQQNEVWYKWAKAKKDAGNNVGQIASMQNAGEGRPNAYLDGNSGVNKYGVSYDTVSYAKKVAEKYQQYKQQTGFNPKPFSQPTDGSQPPTSQSTDTSQSQDEGLGQRLQGRLSDAAGALTDASSGKINPVSGILQTVGAGAGAIGDTVNAGLELIPGVKQVEGLIGQGVGALAQSPVGKPVADMIKQFSTDHPELSADIGAGFNIATAIPIFKGLGLLKNVALDGVGGALQGVAEKAATNDLTEVASRTVAGRGALAETPDAISAMVKERAIPEIVDGRYSTEGAYDNLGGKIANIEEKELQPVLAKATTNNIADRIPLEDLRQKTLAQAETELAGTGNVETAQNKINKIFDENQKKYGDYITLQNANDMKRVVRKGVNFNSPLVDHDVSYLTGQTLQKDIEDRASKLGLGNVKEINGRMSKLIKSQKILKSIEGKTVKLGKFRGLLQKTAGAGTGAFVGNKIGGVPGEIAGGYVGEKVAGLLGKTKVGGFRGGLLK